MTSPESLRRARVFPATRRVLFCLLLLLPGGACWAAKTDIVWLKNGDRVTGEVKGLDRGRLEFSTDHMGTVYIEWEDIAEVTSNIGQAVELANGQRFYGPLAKGTNEDMVEVDTQEGSVGVNILDIVSMYPVEAGFWDRLDISASLGFSWDKGSNVGKYNIGIDTVLRNPRFLSRASFISELTSQQNANTSTRASLDANHLVFHQDKRYHGYFGSVENNDELGLDLRVLLGAGYGTIPVRTPRNILSIGAGIAVNHEIPVDGPEENNIEAVGMMTYDFYKYSHPERTLTTNLRVFPSLTQSGRWRANFTTDFRLELVSDLYWKMSVFASYDNEPASEDASSSDYGVTSSLAYKF
jgi:hypothetical protein